MNHMRTNADLYALLVGLFLFGLLMRGLYRLTIPAASGTTPAGAVTDSPSLGVESVTASPWPAIWAGVITVTLLVWLISRIWKESQR